VPRRKIQWIFGLVTYSVFGYLGMMLAIRSNRDEFSLIIPYVPLFARPRWQDAPLLVDARIVLDGRIVELCGERLSEQLDRPCRASHSMKFRCFSESRDPALRRGAGRAALERFQQECNAIPRSASPFTTAKAIPRRFADTQLLKLAVLLDGPPADHGFQPLHARGESKTSPPSISTTSPRAMRLVLSVGDEAELPLTKEGPRSASGRGVYLPDGTMIVVNHAPPASRPKTMRVVIGRRVADLRGPTPFFGRPSRQAGLIAREPLKTFEPLPERSGSRLFGVRAGSAP